MAEFSVTAPDGRQFRVTAPEGATEADAIAYAQRQMARPEMSMPRGEQGSIDTTREVGFMPRLAASLKMTPEGKIGFLKSIGYNVITDGSGEQYVDTGKGIYPVNRKGFNVNDLADFGGDVAQTIPTIVAGTNPLTVGAAGAGGNAVRQAISGVMPGEDAMSFSDRLKSMAGDAALSAVGQGAVNKVLGGTVSGAAKMAPGASGPVQVPGGIDSVRPHNLFRSIITNAEDRGAGAAAQADELTRATGINWTAGQRTQSKGLLTLEGMLRRNPFSADKWTDLDNQQLGKAVEYLNSTLERLSPSDVGAAMAGGKVKEAFDTTLTGALRARSAQGRADFGAFDQLTGGKPIFDAKNAKAEIDRLIAQYDAPAGGDASSALVDRLKSLRSAFEGSPEQIIQTGQIDYATGKPITKTIAAKPALLTGSEFQRLLEIYGAAAAGKGEIFKDISTAQQRGIARGLRDALDADLGDITANGSGVGAQAADALAAARANWRANSQSIDALEKHVLGRMFGGNYDKAPEMVAEKFTAMKPTEIKSAFKLLDESDPATSQMVKRYLVEDAMSKAGMPQPGNLAPRGQTLGNPEFSPAKFVTAIKKSPAWSVFEPSERFEVETALRAMERLRERAGTDGSPTAPLSQAWEVVRNLMSMNPMTVASGVTGMMAPGKMTEILTTPEGRRAIMQVSTTSPTAKNFSAGLGYLTSLSATDPTQGGRTTSSNPR